MYLHIITQLANLAFNLYTIVEVLFEIGAIKNTVSRRLGEVDDEFVLHRGTFSSGGLGLEEMQKPSVSLLRRELSKAILGLTMLRT